MADDRRSQGHSNGARRGGDAAGTPHVLDRLAVVVRYYKAALVVLVLVVAGMMQRAYTTTPTYEATARVQLDLTDVAQANLTGDAGSGSYIDPEPFYQTELRVLRGRELATRTAHQLHLGDVPEYNGQGPAPTKLTRVVELVRSRTLAPFRSAPAPAAPQADTSRMSDEDLVASFQGNIGVDQVPDTTLIDVSVRSTDPEFAARAANVLAEQYVARNLEKRLDSANQMLEFVNGEVAEQQRKAQDAERRMAEYRESQDAISLDTGHNIVQSRLQQASLEYYRARAVRASAEAQYRQVEKATPEVRAILSAVTQINQVQVTQVQAARNALAELERNRYRLLERYGERHPDVMQVNARIAEQRRQVAFEAARIIDVVRANLETARAEEANAKRELEAQTAATKDLGRKSVDYSVLQRDAESAREMLTVLMQRQGEYRVLSNNRQNNARLLEAARVPGGPISPDIGHAWLMALLFGVGLGIATAFVIDYLDDTVKTPDDVRGKLKLPILGMVPKVAGMDRPLLSDTVPPHFGEALRALRTMLVGTSAGRGTKVICTTSSQPLEGKTTTTVNMALALAIGGAKVLVIDADMRRPSLHKALKIQNNTGLAEVIAGTSKINEAVQRTSHPNLMAMTAGALPDNPSELLACDRMKLMIRQLAHSPFDWVIIDTPPVLAVTDAVILAPLVSGVVFIVGAEMTRWRMAERAIETLQSGQPKSIAVVLNRVDLQRNRYYYWRYYGHTSDGYYRDLTKASQRPAPGHSGAAEAPPEASVPRTDHVTGRLRQATVGYPG